ncbi:hypothetical protein CACET_c18980 [Clostridium aceticum]|uniref:Uncharacterized protein n=1 Tax=Clostridium aceticum TaxID=84022 RepID=A0A0D8IF13_9CLOT|nr:hypothetical protein [Clostridium aceticum]AKL95346.1 hypothetical protein CACET_c18980 [Clostridium aceticum]KJF28843.1 hypothetical protein TZ02_00385 [Clostridium aceticum]
MLLHGISRSNDYKDISLFTIGTLFKLFVLHYFMGLGEGLVLVTLKNFFIVIAIYCLLTLPQLKQWDS